MQITKITHIFFCLILIICSVQARRNIFGKKQNTFTIMLDPAGDAKHTGRTINNTFERGITLQYAEQLKHALENSDHNIKVYLTRFPGEMIHPLQNANYANRLNVDLYININFYQETSTVPKLFLYQFSYHDDFVTPSNKLALLPYDQAHLLHNTTTQKWSELIKEILIKDTQKKFTVHGTYKLPFKPLMGVISPAIGIEIGLKTPQDWQPYVTPITHAISTIIEKCT